jgi:hypothetical protein
MEGAKERGKAGATLKRRDLYEDMTENFCSPTHMKGQPY